MKRIKFVYDAGYVGTEVSEVFEFEDNVTEETIHEELDIWVENTRTDSSWYEELTEEDEEQ